MPAGKGPTLCRGYWNDDAANKQLFTEDGWMRMGDLATIDADGYLTIVGRVKDIIVRRGEKFSAKEIEDLLAEHPDVRQVAVIPVPDPRTGERVCAVVVPADPSRPPSLDELVRFLEARELSRRKLPERLELVDTLPSSGRVLELEIADAVEMGNAWTGRQKGLVIQGRLLDNGAPLGSFRGRRMTSGGFFGGYKGTCSFLGRCAKRLGSDVADWLVAPAENSNIGG